MSVYEDENLIVKPSPIQGLGLFAKRDFAKGEVVTRWQPTRLYTQQEYDSMKLEAKKYIAPVGPGAYAEMGIPEKYVNHSIAANTEAKSGKDVAIREIKAGEEITADYRTEGVDLDFEI